jgi:NhaA family Na+:H+ antiporter
MKPLAASRVRPHLPDRPIRQLTAPVRRFLAVESASGFVLVGCTAVALVLANSPLADAVHHFWDTRLRVGVGRLTLDEPLHFWVNDALMAVFFFVVGLEVKREIVAGELSSVKQAALPVVAAVGGMVVPAAIYLLLQRGTPGERGWGVPMATDIAFVVGLLALFGRRVPLGLKVFLLSLAIVDDIGAILVIAAFYSGGTDGRLLGLGAAGLGLCLLLNRLGVRSVLVYLPVGAGVWLATLAGGVHPTIAGVLLGLVTPARPLVGATALRLSMADLLADMQDDRDQPPELEELELLRFAARETVSPLERLETFLHPWVGFAVMPVFALANAGVAVRLGAVTDPIAVAVAAGLVLGKPVGIVGFSLLAVRLRLARLPAGVRVPTLVGAGCLGGIGFTMALFVAGLAFAGPAQLDAAKVGILLGSGLSAAVGGAILWRTLPRAGKSE